MLSGKSQVQYNIDCMVLLYEHTQTTRTNEKKVTALMVLIVQQQNVTLTQSINKYIITHCGTRQENKIMKQRHNLDFSGK